MDEHKQKIIQYYNTCWLERFEKGHNPKSFAMHMGYFDSGSEDNDLAKLSMNRFLAERLHLENKTEGVIVDAGCGVGGTLFYLNNNFPQFKYIGINLSQEQIAVLQRNKPKQCDIELLVEDYCNTSLKNSSVDMLYGIESICHAENKESFAREAYRVLKPGGMLLMLDYIHNPQNSTEDSLVHLKSFEEGWSVKSYWREPLVSIKNVGFEIVVSESILQKVMPGINKSYYGAIQKISSLNGNINLDVKRHLNACISLKYLTEIGQIDYQLIMARKPKNF